MTTKTRRPPARKTGPSQFEQAWRDLPACVDADPMAVKTLDDLRWACVIQLDLIEEGQDGTEADDPQAIRRWLKRWNRPIAEEFVGPPAPRHPPVFRLHNTYGWNLAYVLGDGEADVTVRRTFRGEDAGDLRMTPEEARAHYASMRRQGFVRSEDVL